MKLNTQIVLKNVSEIKPYDKNAKMHTPDQIEYVANSIAMFGFVQPLVIDAKGFIVIGHCRFSAALKMDLKQVPVVIADYLTDDQIKALRLADNKLNESYWDRPTLDVELAELKTVDIDMSKLGFIIDTFEIAPEEEKEKEEVKSSGKLSLSLSPEQYKTVMSAIADAANDCEMPDESGNKDNFGNAIAYICQKYLDNL